ncbi:hypothetical protein CARUB_v10021678mg, partial [Capsella rubella]
MHAKSKGHTKLPPSIRVSSCVGRRKYSSPNNWIIEAVNSCKHFRAVVAPIRTYSSTCLRRSQARVLDSSIMAPTRNTRRSDGREDEQHNEWAELRRTLLAMQENIQEQENHFGRERGQRPRRLNGSREGDHEDKRWELGFKLDIPEFHGSIRGDELLDWLVAVDEVMEFKQVPDSRKVALVATKFRGRAASWWLQLKATRARIGKDKHLKHSFLPQNYDRTIYRRLQNLRQGGRSVDEYADEFYLLITRNEIFDRGLRPQIQNALMQFDPTTIAEAQRRAVAFEQQFKTSATWNANNRSRQAAAALPNPLNKLLFSVREKTLLE